MDLNSVKANKAAAAEFMEAEITSVIKEFGKRGPGSEGEKKACEYMADTLRDLGCDDVKVEPFELHPAAFMGWIYITVTLILAAFGLFFVPHFAGRIVSVVLIVVGMVIMIGEFVMYRKVVDKIYPKKVSHNVTAVKKPTGEVRRRVFFNGHPDAACEWTFNYLGGGVLFGGHVIFSIIGVLYLLGVTIASFFVEGILITQLALGTLCFVPAWLLMYIMWNEGQIVDGANDNLTGCYMGIAVLKALKDAGIELEHTEIGVLISGAEEAGLRGAKAWAAAHKDDYKDVPTYIIAYDTIRESKYLQVNKRDLNASVKADEDISRRFKAAADSLGVNCLEGSVPFLRRDGLRGVQSGRLPRGRHHRHGPQSQELLPHPLRQLRQSRQGMSCGLLRGVRAGARRLRERGQVIFREKTSRPVRGGFFLSFCGCFDKTARITTKQGELPRKAEDRVGTGRTPARSNAAIKGGYCLSGA